MQVAELVQLAQGGGGVSILGDIQNPTGHGPGQRTVGDPTLSRVAGLFLSCEMLVGTPDGEREIRGSKCSHPILSSDEGWMHVPTAKCG